MHSKNVCWRTLAAAVAFGAASAASVANETREHEAHEHGHGTLDVVASGDELVLALRMPAVNVVGFEHEPSTEEQHRLVEEAIETFEDAEALFVPSADAKCSVEEVTVALAGLSHEGEHHDEDKHGHDDAHKDEDHDEETHSELEAEYHFHCDNPQALENVGVKLFAHLHDTEEIEARVVTDTLQTAIELTENDTMVPLKR